MSKYFVDESDCSRRNIFPGVDIQTVACRSMMMSLVEFHPYAVVEKHSHPHEQVGIIIEGRAHFFVGEDDRVLGPGDMYRIPGGVEHRVVALDQPVKAFDIFTPIREDYL
jgi:quercetin dioxygenase-like cupin family protein